jgi:translocation and assembly module TamA
MRVLAILLLWVASLCGLAAAQDLPTIPYTLTVNGPADEEVRTRILAELTLEKRREQGVPSIGVLEARLARDVARAKEVLSAFGYYDGTVTPVLTDGGTSAAVTLTIDQGLLYKIGRFDILWQGGKPPTPVLAFATGLPASGRNIVAAGERVIAKLRTDGYFDAAVVERRAVLDRPSGKVDVTLTMTAGGVVTVGGFDVEGAKEIPELRIQRLSTLEVGELLTPKRLKDAEDRLLEAGMFNEARADAVGTAPARTIRLTVGERPMRTISGAIKWSLQDGFAIEAAWEHRNIFGDAERLRTALTLGQQRQALEVSLRRYDTIFDGHTLLATFEIAREDVDGQIYENTALIGTLETDLYDKIVGRYGASVEFVRDQGLTNGGDYALIGVRGEVSFDNSNDLLDPTDGYRITLRALPYLGYNGDLRNFVILEALGTAYLPLDRQKEFVLAGRVRVGSIFGEARDDIPLPKRFFAGGGGSIRGYSYKRAGPLGIDDEPIGGASVIEVNGEARWRINEDFGAVAFVDGGGAFEGALPGDGGDWFIGAGLGVRYYSPIGPVRLDVAAPINARAGEPGVQVYISIGQAF